MSRPRKTKPVDDGLTPEIPDHVIEELARHVKTPDDLNRLSRQLLKLTVEKKTWDRAKLNFHYPSTFLASFKSNKNCCSRNGEATNPKRR